MRALIGSKIEELFTATAVYSLILLSSQFIHLFDIQALSKLFSEETLMSPPALALFIAGSVIFYGHTRNRKHFYAWGKAVLTGRVLFQRTLMTTVIFLWLIIVFSPYSSSALIHVSSIYLMLWLIVSAASQISFCKALSTNTLPPKPVIQDALRRDNLIKQIRKRIDNYIQDGSQHDEDRALAISIEGAWGQGKSWVLTDLKNKYSTNDHIVWVSFSAWDILADSSGRVHAKALFDHISQELLNSGHYSADLNGALNKYLTVIAGNISRKIGFPWENHESPSTTILKNKISQFIRESNIHLVICLDDIDRINEDKTKQYLGLIQTILNFDNTIVIALFDTAQMMKIIRAEFDEIYLEKLFEYRFALPIAEKHVKEVLRKRLVPILSEERASDILAQYLNEHSDTLNIGASALSLRRIHRISEDIADLYNAQLSHIDLFGILIIKNASPSLYEWVRTNQTTVTSTYSKDDSLLNDSARTRRKASIEKMLLSADATTVKIFYKIFPNIEKFVTGEQGVRYRGEYRYQNYINDSKWFYAYFGEDLEDISFEPLMKKYIQLNLQPTEAWKENILKSMEEHQDFQEYFLNQVFHNKRWRDQLSNPIKEKISEIEIDLDSQKFHRLEEVCPDYGNSIEARMFLTDDSELNLRTLKYCLRESKGLDARFFWASQYVNKCYWYYERDANLSKPDREKGHLDHTSKLFKEIYKRFKKLVENGELSNSNREATVFFIIVFQRILTKCIPNKLSEFNTLIQNAAQRDKQLMIHYVWSLEPIETPKYWHRDEGDDDNKTPPVNKIDSGKYHHSYEKLQWAFGAMQIMQNDKTLEPNPDFDTLMADIKNHIDHDGKTSDDE